MKHFKGGFLLWQTEVCLSLWRFNAVVAQVFDAQVPYIMVFAHNPCVSCNILGIMSSLFRISHTIWMLHHSYSTPLPKEQCNFSQIFVSGGSLGLIRNLEVQGTDYQPLETWNLFHSYFCNLMKINHVGITSLLNIFVKYK